jgi:hypothetical protein
MQVHGQTITVHSLHKANAYPVVAHGCIQLLLMDFMPHVFSNGCAIRHHDACLFAYECTQSRGFHPPYFSGHCTVHHDGFEIGRRNDCELAHTTLLSACRRKKQHVTRKSENRKNKGGWTAHTPYLIVHQSISRGARWGSR